ncbi:MAG TPA: tetratricopeptide repeat protein [Terriglobales bacterium]|nr:tetratricopeptide repeat protein [Terriglobales bacterium]
MARQSFRRALSFFVLAFGALQVWPALSVAQTADANNPQVREALDLYQSGKMVEAMPLLEDLVARYPADSNLKVRWAYSVASYAATLTDPEQRKEARLRARKIALEAQAAGAQDSILFTILEWIPEDGSEAAFSPRKEVDAAMKEAEADFVRGDLDKARDGCLRALLLDPNNYEAALFTGDTYFRQRTLGSAGEWFSRAVQIDPNQETAYRYWGDALMLADKMDEARSKFIQAIIAEPYKRLSWQGVNQWAQRNHVTLNWVRLQDRSQVSAKDDKHISITIQDTPKDDPNAVAWISYGLGRAGWHGELFAKEFPNEPKYRRTLKEEAYALGLMVKVLKEQKDFEKISAKLDPGLLALIKIDDAGLLEPFVLLNRADEGIAQDYIPYRLANRDKLTRYLDEFVVPKTPAIPEAAPEPR